MSAQYKSSVACSLSARLVGLQHRELRLRERISLCRQCKAYAERLQRKILPQAFQSFYQPLYLESLSELGSLFGFLDTMMLEPRLNLHTGEQGGVMGLTSFV